jgi:hypothetical protein
MTDTKKSLVRKLAEVMAVVERIPKRGRNDFHKYDYATEADIAATVRKELASRHVMLIPAIVGESRHPVGDKGSVLTVIEMEMEFLDGETGESIKKPWRGYGTDKEDKGGYKAMTGGEKYFLLKTFLMPTGDDPERDESPRAATVRHAPPVPAGYEEWLITFGIAANKGVEALRDAYKAAKPAHRDYLTKHDARYEDIRKRAEAKKGAAV